MAITSYLTDPLTDTTVKITPRGELVTGRSSHSKPYAAQRTTAGVSNLVKHNTGKLFVITYVIVSSDKTNVDTQISLYETLTEDGDLSTSEQIILAGGLSKNDRVVLGGLDLVTSAGSYINVETDTAATIDVIIMGYYEEDL